MGSNPAKLVKALANPKNIGAAIDPGGLVYTSKDKDIAGFQGKVDLLGIGAKPELAARQQATLNAEQAASVASEKSIADAALEARRQRMMRKDRGRSSLLTGTELGTQNTLSKTLG